MKPKIIFVIPFTITASIHAGYTAGQHT